MAESLFARLKCEPIGRRSFKTKTEARLTPFTYTEGWYNPRRRQSALGYREDFRCPATGPPRRVLPFSGSRRVHRPILFPRAVLPSSTRKIA
jgi:putative transposase